MSIGSKVKRFRELKNISQEDLALRLDVAQSTISSIESDKSIPNSILLNKIAKELEVDINDFFNEANNIMTNNEFHDNAIAAVNQYNPVFNIQPSIEVIESILKNQEQITKLVENQNLLISKLLQK